MKPIVWRFAVAVFIIVSAARTVAAAEVPINYQQVYGSGFATDEEVEGALGTLTFSMTECGHRGLGSISRSVRVTSSKSDYGNRRVIETMLRRAAEFAWGNCPLHFWFGGSYLPALQRDIDRVDLYLPDGSQALRAANLLGDLAFNEGKSYKWGSVQDVGEQLRQEAAQKAAEAQRQRAAAEAAARSAAEWDQFWSNVWLWIKILFWGAIAAWLFSMRETIMRWYYFLTPHPATGMVEATMHRGVELDGKAFAEIMRPIPGGRIEKEVRAEQARALAERAHRYAETMRAEADRIKAEAQRETEFIKAQDELAKAAIVHEKAKARLDALRKRVR
ncbi:MAG: hypothetical protein Q7R90_01560 [bacterium]|nr:hypothetical protein [bacterium]